MTTQQLIDKPGYGTATQDVIDSRNWDYDYPQWFFEKIEDVLSLRLTEYQRIELRKVYEEIMEDMG